MHNLNAAILYADITESTGLYERLGDSAALALVNDRIATIKDVIAASGGEVVSQKGDDVLSYFVNPAQAIGAARTLLAAHGRGPLSLHIGAHYGSVVASNGDIFGDAVNVTCRLAALANPGELLCSLQFAELLAPHDAGSLRDLGGMLLKGKRNPVQIYSLADGSATQTQLPQRFRTAQQNSEAEALLFLRLSDRTYICDEGASLSIGRSDDSNIVLALPWISRKHALASVQGGSARLQDTSSSGTHVRFAAGDAGDLLLHRNVAPLVGSGVISPALPVGDPRACHIVYHIGRR